MIALKRLNPLRLCSFSVLVAALMGVASLCLLEPARAAEPVRGVWVASVGSAAMMTPDGIKATVARCKRIGINTLFVVTWNRGVTLYPSELARRELGVAIDPRLEGRDPLKEVIDAAHAEGLKVIAWFEFGFSSSYRDPTGGTLLQKRPGWSALDPDGKLVSRNGFQWMNGFDPEVQGFLLDMLKEVVSNYDIDGVQGDDRLPAQPNTAGYDPLTVSLYQAEHNGASPPDDPSDREWTQWRADRLSRFVQRAYRELKAIEPDLIVSWSPSVYPWSKQNYLQDWPRWANEGWGDLFCPQLYRKDPGAYREEVRKLAEVQVAGVDRAKIAPGILIGLADGYDLPGESLRAMVAANREFGYQNEVYFYEGGFDEHGELIRSIYEAE